MKAIYECKLYKCSPRQYKIYAAINDPLNAQLVMQLKQYLDDEYIEMMDVEEVDDLEAVDQPKTVDEEFREDVDPDIHNSNHVSEDTPDEDIDHVSEDTPDEDIDSAVAIDAETNSSTPCNQWVTSLTEVAGMLNANADTQGVIRTSINNDELWIYYNDKLNLNNLMGAVISLLDASSHSELRFNRLARSDNAIVFDILKRPDYDCSTTNIEGIDE